jgi:restriction system protein
MKRRTIKQAIVEVLKQEKKPLTVKDIYTLIIERDYYRFNAQNPLNIVQGEIRRHCVGVEFPTAHPIKHFQILKNGTYWLKDTDVPGISISEQKTEFQIRKTSESLKLIIKELKITHLKHTNAFKQQILNQLKNIEPVSFEHFSKKLLEVYGFVNLTVTKPSKDGGIDGYGELKIGLTHLNVAFQCKRWKNNPIGRTEIDKFRGAIQGEFEQGIIFTTSTFTKDSLKATRKSGAVPIILIDGAAIIDIMIQKQFGVEFESMPVYINTLDNIFND